MKQRSKYAVFFLIPIFLSCGKTFEFAGYGQARGFSLEKNRDGRVVSAQIAVDGQLFTYEFCDHGEALSARLNDDLCFRVSVPQKRVAVCTSTMLVLLDEIGESDTVVGMDGDYTTVPVFRKKIERGEIAFLADGMVLDREKLAALRPEVVFYSPAAGDRVELRKILDCGAVPVPIGDWREPDILGRTRWAELEAAFFGKADEAAALFRETERRYRELAEETVPGGGRPRVLFHLPVNGLWRMPSADSFMASAVRDAGGDYPMPDSASETVLLDLETVFTRFSGASVWLIHTGTYGSRESFVKTALSAFGDSRLKDFSPLETARIAVNDRMLDERGFNGFYDYSPLHPDWLLEDLKAILNGGEPVRFYRILK